MRPRALYPLAATAALLAGTIAPLALAQPLAPAERITCSGGRQFLLRTSTNGARVQIGTRQLNLPRKPSALSERYAGTEGTLMLDGEFVAFVPKGDAGWKDCRRSKIIPASSPKG
ncbi:hypothetical protein GGR39_003127 [Novosphingobium fluoreni]|uniref:C-type lysozyme inhibitor domain-containing protein n=1 Tax=Novosphingobium fluoreni TaxID=1391222 RepID=A0A7W6C3F8_9SPHN|nr:hypothetical protein [Novosphingobium fluoreni]MBB3941450.1 hypothetical protein [Novosphingobium fluoreni]